MHHFPFGDVNIYKCKKCDKLYSLERCRAYSYSSFRRVSPYENIKYIKNNKEGVLLGYSCRMCRLHSSLYDHRRSKSYDLFHRNKWSIWHADHPHEQRLTTPDKKTKNRLLDEQPDTHGRLMWTGAPIAPNCRYPNLWDSLLQKLVILDTLPRLKGRGGASLSIRVPVHTNYRP